jgi:predicted SprT family Zn-dependent metalloprotease
MAPDLKGLNQLLKLEFERLNKERFNGQIQEYKLKFHRTSCRTHGRINLAKKEIMISLPMYEQYGWPAVTQTLLHEMVHALFHQEGRHVRHTKAFWREFEKRGGTREKIDVKPKNPYTYACPTCESEIERARRIRNPGRYSCAKCDRKYNPKHRLYLKESR